MRKDEFLSQLQVTHATVVGIITETDLLRQICRARAQCSPGVAGIVVSYP